jgi:predicted TIM-barrel fold metal-dependent hydrolase
VVPQEDATFAVEEIERRAVDPMFVQILLSPRSGDPLGHRRYWPIFAAAERARRPIGLHVQGYSGGHASTGSGWPTYYMQEHYAMVGNMQAVMASLVFEGVFERFPGLKIVLIEGGFAWVPALTWRMDKHWERMRKETPHVKRPPSDYVREHFWFTTQPIEEPENPTDLAEIMEWIGYDRLMFSTDYPHWDFDDPQRAFKAQLTEQQRAGVFRDNAKALYAL